MVSVVLTLLFVWYVWGQVCTDIVRVVPDSLLGTRDDYVSLDNGLTIARVTSRKTILMLQGDYIFQQSINLLNGLIIEGGYVINSDNEWTRDDNAISSITLQPPVSTYTVNGTMVGHHLGVEGINVSSFQLRHLSLSVLPSGANGAQNSRGISIYGIHLFGCTDFLIHKVRVTTGSASSGTSGNTGEIGGSGESGGSGTSGNIDTSDACGYGGYGGGGGGGTPRGPATSSTCGSTSTARDATSFRAGGSGGPGGAGGKGDSGKCAAVGSKGGSGGWNGVRFNITGGPFGSAGCSSNPGNRGSSPSSDGADGNTLDGYNWLPNDRDNDYSFGNYFLPGGQAFKGGDGSGGAGGGGGGGGGGQYEFLFAIAGGAGGFGGGSTFGIYAIASTGTVSQSLFYPGPFGLGGAGGNGGSGGLGAGGGAGGTGDSCGGSQIGCGGLGGKGGNGASGGRGRDGSNGISQGVFNIVPIENGAEPPALLSTTCENILRSSSGKGNSNHGAVVGLSVVFSLLFCAIIVGLVAFYFWKQRKQKINPTELPSRYDTVPKDLELQIQPVYIKPPESNAWELEYSELVFEREIGSGGFGIVFKGTWRQATVAIKKLNPSLEITEQQLEEFRAEGALMVQLRPHPNVVLCMGICTRQLPFCIVTEYVDGGSLYFLLRSGKKLDTTLLMSLIKGIALGLMHLHLEKLVHRDLAARNILLKTTKDGYEPKISDFGLSRMTETKNSSAQTRNDSGPLKIMAPECLIKREYSPKSDVWALAVLFSEIFTKDEPYPQLDAVQVATQVARGELVPSVPSSVPSVITQIVALCGKWEPNERPSMEEICQMLEATSK